jgi:hypothetical protein
VGALVTGLHVPGAANVATDLRLPRSTRAPRSDRGSMHACGLCGTFGHSRRTCARRNAPDQARMFDDAPPPPPPPVDCGPWSTCPAGDPWCPGVACEAHT